MKKLLLFVLSFVSAIGAIAQTITMDQLPSPKFCQNSEFQITYTVSGTFDPGNAFIAVIADSTGDFFAGDTIGFLFSETSGSISCSIPSAVGEGNGFLIKIVSTLPAVESNISSAFEVDFNPGGVTEPSGSIHVCEGQTITIDANISGDSYSWNSGESTSSITATTSGQYRVQIFQSNGCSYITPNVLVDISNPSPSVQASGPVQFCDGSNVTLTIDPFPSILWNTNDTVGFATSESVTISTTGIYFATVVDNEGCSGNSDSTFVTAFPIPIAPSISPAGPLSVCSGQTIQLTSSESLGNFWSGTVSNPTDQSVNVGPGLYFLTYTDANGCTVSGDPIEVSAITAPTANISTSSGTTEFCTGGSITLFSDTIAGNSWSNGTSTNNLITTTPGIYILTVTSSNGCTANDTIFITESSCVPAAQISSNTCGNNSVSLTGSILANFVPGASSYEFEISDATGTTVLSTTSYFTRTMPISNITPALNWNTSYNVRARVVVNGIAGPFGTPCSFSTIADPALVNLPTTQLAAGSCGATLTNIGSISANAVTGATRYQFEFSQNNTPVLTYLQVSRTLNIATVFPSLAWGNTYQVRVRCYFGTDIAAFGNSCNVTFVADPNVVGVPNTQLIANNCGRLNFTLSTASISANAVSNANRYEFEFSQSGTVVATGFSSNRFCKLSSVTPALTSGQQYSVRVRAYIGTVPGNYGVSCTIGTVLGSRFENPEAEEQISDNTTAPALSYMPNPFNESIKINISNAENLSVDVRIYNLEGKLIESAYGIRGTVEMGQALSQGLYILEVVSSDGWVKRERIIKAN